MFCEMSPVIEESIVRISEGRWKIGSSMICEREPITGRKDVLVSWVDHDGKTFHLSKSHSQPTSTASTAEGENSGSQIDLVHKAGTSAAVWAFGGVHIKVKSWIPGLQSEHDTIKEVQSTNIPIPEVIHSWIDEQWNRTFLILRSIKGRTLFQAWPALTHTQKSTIAQQIASYCVRLALQTSPRMETLGHEGVREDWLTKAAAPSEPSWKPNVQGPFTAGQLRTYLGDASIEIGSEFHLYHADLGPTNIILDDSDCVAAIIDWESAAFYPRFWIATKPLFSAGFNLAAGADRSAWAFLLSEALEDNGFKADADLYRSWKAALKD